MIEGPSQAKTRDWCILEVNTFQICLPVQAELQPKAFQTILNQNQYL